MINNKERILWIVAIILIVSFLIYNTNNKKEEVYLFGGGSVIGNYGGIGVKFGYNYKGNNPMESVVIQEVASGSPAQKSGILVGDIVDKIDNIKLQGLNTPGIEKLFRGEVGSFVLISGSREGKPVEFNVKREIVCCDYTVQQHRTVYNSKNFLNWEKVTEKGILTSPPFYYQKFFFDQKIMFFSGDWNVINLTFSNDLENWLDFSTKIDLPVSPSHMSNTTHVIVPSYEKLYAFFDSHEYKYKDETQGESLAGNIEEMKSRKFVYVSEDGINWQSDLLPSWWKDCSCSMEITGSFLFKGKLFIVLAEYDPNNSSSQQLKLISTDNAMSWETVDENLLSSIIVPFKNKLLMYKYDSDTKKTVIYSSRNGSKWDLVSSTELLFDNNDRYYNEFYSLNNKLFLQSLTQSGAVYSSTTNGVSWKKEDMTANILSKMTGFKLIILPEKFRTH